MKRDAFIQSATVLGLLLGTAAAANADPAVTPKIDTEALSQKLHQAAAAQFKYTYYLSKLSKFWQKPLGPTTPLWAKLDALEPQFNLNRDGSRSSLANKGVTRYIAELHDKAPLPHDTIAVSPSAIKFYLNYQIKTGHGAYVTALNEAVLKQPTIAPAP